MTSTPQRSPLNTSIFSPVRTVDHLSPRAIKIDALGLRQRIKSIAKTLVENHSKWLAVHTRGLSLCNQIETVKQQALDELRGEPTRSAYPDTLRTPCAKFKVIVGILDDVLEAARDAERQLHAIDRMDNASVNGVLFKSWTLSRIRECVAVLCEAYAKELPIRRKCMEEIAHSRTKEELVLHVCVWQFPCYVNDRLRLEVLCLQHECDIEALVPGVGGAQK